MTFDKPPVDAAPMTIKRKRSWPMALFIGLAVMTILAVGSVIYAFNSLGPVNASDNQTQRFVVKEGESAAVIAQNLESAGLIKNAFIFQLYTKFTGKNASLLAGGYVLKKSFSLAEIADHISSGKTDEITVTILPVLEFGGVDKGNVRP